MSNRPVVAALAELVLPATVSLDLRGSSKEAVLAELVGLLEAAGAVNGGAVAVEAVLAREKLGSTGCGSGVAVPHARVAGLERPAVAVGVSRAGIEFSAVDGQPVKIFFLILGPAAAPEAYLKVLSQVAKVIKEPEFRAALLDCREPARAIELLRAAQ